MEIVVCVKQVPKSGEGRFDTVSNTVVRQNQYSQINQMDSYALSHAVAVKKQRGNTDVITAISMGPLFAENMLRDCMAKGADKGVLLSDKAFAGSDTLATAYVLSKGIASLGSCGLILCGTHSSDGETGHVGPSLAEMLQINCITNVLDVLSVTDRLVRVVKETDYGHHIIDAEMPLLITVAKESSFTNIVSFREMMNSRKASIQLLKANDLNIDLMRCGKNGSMTEICRTYANEIKGQGELFQGTPSEQAKMLMEKIMESNYLNLKH